VEQIPFPRKCLIRNSYEFVIFSNSLWVLKVFFLEDILMGGIEYYLINFKSLNETICWC
jgi:hypothetical protein